MRLRSANYSDFVWEIPGSRFFRDADCTGRKVTYIQIFPYEFQGRPLQRPNSSLTDHILCVKKKVFISVTFKVFTAVTMKITAFWAVTPCTLLG
jgi:hypothetical protein